jgi:hypothetical protein
LKPTRFTALSLAITMASCTSGPSSPTSAPIQRTVAGQTEGAVSADAIATTRIRLRRVGGNDIVIGLQNGQVVNVPADVKLDIWAEITRLETDRARLFVDWGNGNVEITGCGSCRLENTYGTRGRYTLTVRVIDLNAPTGAEDITSITVTVNVVDPMVCDPVAENFDAQVGMSLPVTLPGVSIRGLGAFGTMSGSTAVPPISNGFVFSQFSTTFEFQSDKNQASLGLVSWVASPTTYELLDANGAIVGAGTVSLTLPAIYDPRYAGGFLTISDQTFRSIVIRGTLNGIYTDGVFASCR